MRIILTFGAIVATALMIGAASSTAATVTVIKGNEIEKISTARKSRMPLILRGQDSANDLKQALNTAPTPAFQVIPVGGDTLWLRNTATGEIVACSVRSSGMVGQEYVRCTGKRL
jgi:hypothetical protein